MTEYEKYLNILSIVYYVLAAIVALFVFRFHTEIAALLAPVRGPGRTGLLGFLVLVGGLAIAGALMVTAARLRERKNHTFCVVIASLLCMFPPAVNFNAGQAAVTPGHSIPATMVLAILTLLVLTREPVKHLFGVRLTPVPPRAGTGRTGTE